MKSVNTYTSTEFVEADAKVFDGSSWIPFGVEVEISATLNSGSATITFYEDSSGDGIPDTSVTYTLIDGVETYSLADFAMESGNDVWYDLSLDNGDVTETVKIDYLEFDY